MAGARPAAPVLLFLRDFGPVRATSTWVLPRRRDDILGCGEIVVAEELQNAGIAGEVSQRSP